MNVFIHKNEQRMGPFSPTEIYAMLDRGEITDSDFAWTDGLPGWQPLSSLLPQAQPAAPPPAAPPSDNRARIIFAAVIRYAVGIALCVVAIIAQEAHRTYSAPVRVFPDTAELIGGATVIACYIPAAIVWYRYFKGRHGSIMGLIGFIGLTQQVGGLLGRVFISL